MSEPARRIDRDSERSVYRQLADILFEQIRTGELPPGADLPSGAELRAAYGVGARTVEMALAVLKGRGIIILERGRVGRVRPTPMTGSERYALGARNYQPDQESTFAAEHGVPWSAFQLDRLYEPVDAPPQIAVALNIPIGTPMIRRRWIHAHDGVPLRISWSYLEAAVWGDTILCDPDEPPWPGGTIAQLRHLGHKPVVDPPTTVIARPGTDEECELLHVEPDLFMLVSLRVHCEVGGFFNSMRMLEAALHVTPYYLGQLHFNSVQRRTWNLYG